MKLKNRKIDDPELGSGWSYFVEATAYEKHIRENFEDGEVCTFYISIYLAKLIISTDTKLRIYLPCSEHRQLEVLKRLCGNWSRCSGLR